MFRKTSWVRPGVKVR